MNWELLLGFLGLIGAWVTSILSWRQTQGQKRRQEEYERREGLYRDLLTKLSVFYKGTNAAEGAAPFVQSVRLAWLYAPDDVIHKLYAFLETQREGLPDVERNTNGQSTMAELVAAIRADLFTPANMETNLTAKDYRHQR